MRFAISFRCVSSEFFYFLSRVVSAFLFFRLADRGDEIEIISLARFIEGVLSFDSCGGFHRGRVCAWRETGFSQKKRVLQLSTAWYSNLFVYPGTVGSR
jgi:hypothetical protein